eukprot:118492-Rhodomonas_salina.3
MKPYALIWFTLPILTKSSCVSARPSFVSSARFRFPHHARATVRECPASAMLKKGSRSSARMLAGVSALSAAATDWMYCSVPMLCLHHSALASLCAAAPSAPPSSRSWTRAKARSLMKSLRISGCSSPQHSTRPSSTRASSSALATPPTTCGVLLAARIAAKTACFNARVVSCESAASRPHSRASSSAYLAPTACRIAFLAMNKCQYRCPSSGRLATSSDMARKRAFVASESEASLSTEP